jgi:hypothetical protein
MTTPPTYTYYGIQKIVTNFQESGKAAFATHAWSTGFLGATLADLLYYHVPPQVRDRVLQDLEEYTKRNIDLNVSP